MGNLSQATLLIPVQTELNPVQSEVSAIQNQMAALGTGATATVPAVVAAPTVSGVLIVGNVLTCNHGTWSSAATPTYSYQWARNGTAISGAVGSSYTLVTADVGNTLTCTVTATNTAGPGVSVTTAATGTIASSGTAPTLTADTPPTSATVGAAYGPYTFTATGTGTVFFTAAGTVPPGLTLSSAGVLSGTPTTAGTYTFTVTATGGVSPAATSGTITVAVAAAPTAQTAPTFTADTPPATLTVGTAYTGYTFAASGTPTIAFTATGLPPGLTLTTSGTLTGTPTTAGSYTAVVTATNPVNPAATVNVTFTVSAAAGTAVTPGSVLFSSYAAYDDESYIVSFMNQLGVPLTEAIAMDFVAADSWSQMANALSNAQAAAWAPWTGTMMWAVPMLVNGSPVPVTTTNSILPNITAGDYDSYFTTLADQIASFTSTGTGKAPYIRMGWEFNGNWFTWGIGVGNSTLNAQFVAAWQHIHSVMSPILPAGTKWIWNPTSSISVGGDVSGAYPGNAYVDVVGLDIYNGYWNSYPGDATFYSDVTNNVPGLAWLASFCAANNKMAAIPEFGLVTASSAAGTTNSPGDDPTFIANILGWVQRTAEAGTSVIVGFWNDGTGALSYFPNSQAEVLSLVPSLLAISSGATTTAAPTLTSDTPPSATIGSTYSYTFSAASTVSVSYSATGTLPPGLSFSPAGSGVLTGTPTTAGSYTFTIKATNTGGTTSASVTIVVGAAPTNEISIVGTPTSFSLNYGTTVSLAMPSGFQANDVAYASVTTYTTNAQTTPTGWTLLSSAALTNGPLHNVYRKILTGSEPATLNVTIAASGQQSGALIVLRGANSAPEDVVGTVNTGNSGAPSINGVTTTATNDYLLAFVSEAQQQAQPTTFSSPLSGLADSGSVANYTSDAIGGVLVSGAGATGNYNATWPTGNRNWSTVAIAVKHA